MAVLPRKDDGRDYRWLRTQWKSDGAVAQYGQQPMRIGTPKSINEGRCNYAHKMESS